VAAATVFRPGPAWRWTEPPRGRRARAPPPLPRWRGGSPICARYRPSPAVDFGDAGSGSYWLGPGIYLFFVQVPFFFLATPVVCPSFAVRVYRLTDGG
jgi:hypothetical protein